MWHRFSLLAAASALIFVVGCSKDEEPIRNPAGSSAVPSLPPAGMDAESMSKAHSQPNGSSSQDLEKLKKAQAAAKAAFEKDPTKKKAYVDATVELGTATMYARGLTPREMYGGALKLYREALAVDPNNKEAKENKELIEKIYKDMGRPIPE